MYELKEGERAIVAHRIGNKITSSGGYMHRILASVAIEKPNGKLVYRGHTPYWIANSRIYASHYKSGLNKSNQAAYNRDVTYLNDIANTINKDRMVDKFCC